MNLIYIITYNCNFRCKYCNVTKRDKSISLDVIKASFKFLSKNGFNAEKVKFFGGEPLLKKNEIKYILTNFPSLFNTKFFLTTNTTLIDDDFFNFSKKNNLKITFSIDGNKSTISKDRILDDGTHLSDLIINNTKKYHKDIRVNQVITSKNSIDFFKNFKFIYQLGVRSFNFLPEYYVEWSKIGLNNIKVGFSKIIDFHKLGNKFNLINLDNYSHSSFFNFGLNIDTNGDLYMTNIFLYKEFEKYKNELIVGDVFSGLKYNVEDNDFIINYNNIINQFIKKEYNKNILVSVKYIDLILNSFCLEYKSLNNFYY